MKTFLVGFLVLFFGLSCGSKALKTENTEESQVKACSASAGAAIMKKYYCTNVWKCQGNSWICARPGTLVKK